MGLIACGCRTEDVLPAAVRSVAGGDIERIRSLAIRHRLLRERRRYVVLRKLFLSRLRLFLGTEIVPIGQCPHGRPTQLDDISTYLRFQGQEVTAMPRSEKPRLVLTLLPVLSRGWRLKGIEARHRRRRRYGAPSVREVNRNREILQVLTVNGGKEPPARRTADRARLHGTDSSRIPEEVGIVERPALV